MRWSLVKLELGLLRHDRASLVVMVVFALLVAWASWQGGVRVEQRRASDTAALDGAQARVDKAIADKVTAEIAGREAARPVAVLPPRPLGGVVDRQAGPTRVEATAAPLLEAKARDALDAEAQAAGPLDLLFVLIQLLPLVVIALSYDILSGDRERGTLTLLLSQPLRLRDLLLAKAVARLLALGAVGAVASGVALMSGAIDVGAAGGLVDLLWMAGLLVLWMAFWFAAALAVNAWGKTSSGNALALTTLWLVLVVVGPGLLRSGVEAAYPPPSRVELATAARDAASASEEALEAMEGDHREGKEQPRTDQQAAKAAAERELRARLAPLRQGFEEALGNQQSLIDGMRVLSPALTTSEALVALAGEDIARRRGWLDAVEKWHSELRAWFAQQREREALPELAQMPRFEPYAQAAEGVTGRLVMDLITLLAWILLALVIAGLGLRRETGRLT